MTPEPRGVGKTALMADEVVGALLTLDTTPPPEPAVLERLTAAAGMSLPREYLVFMALSDGGDGDLGETWIEIWPAARVLEALERLPHYEGVVLFGGDGANTVYGFDRFRDGRVIEGDWIGLNRDELIERGTFAEFVMGLVAARE
jgi:hypothetical protein